MPLVTIFFSSSSLPFQRLPDVAREKMFTSGPFFPSVRFFINMILLLPGERGLLVGHQVFCVRVSEEHPSVRFSLFNERTTWKHKGCPALSFTGLTGDDDYILSSHIYDQKGKLKMMAGIWSISLTKQTHLVFIMWIKSRFRFDLEPMLVFCGAGFNWDLNVKMSKFQQKTPVNS